jgi:hypothetical protein
MKLYQKVCADLPLYIREYVERFCVYVRVSCTERIGP